MTLLALGPLRFTALQVRGLRDGRTWKRILHETIEDLPVKQTVGREPMRPEFKVKLHPELGDAALTVVGLELLGDSGAAVPLVLGNGFLIGWFTVNGVARDWEWAAPDGTLIEAELTISLEQSRPPPPDLGPGIGLVGTAPPERTQPIEIPIIGDPSEIPLAQVARL